MGILGWELLKDNVTLKGVVVHENRDGDGDWCIRIRPSPGFEHLLINSKNHANMGEREGLIECEIEPNEEFDSKDNEEKFFKRLLGKEVLVTGTWCEDNSHVSNPFGDLPHIGPIDLNVIVPTLAGRTEIHPITSILVEEMLPNGVKEVEFFVFSDDSNISGDFRHFAVLFTGQNRTANFRVEFPRPHNPDSLPAYAIIDEIDRVREKNLTIITSNGVHFLEGRFQSGIAPESGFYHAKYHLFPASKGSNPNPVNPNPINKESNPSVQETQQFSTGEVEFAGRFLLHLQIKQDDHTVHLIIDAIPNPIAMALVRHISKGHDYRITWENRRPGGLNHHIATLKKILFL